MLISNTRIRNELAKLKVKTHKERWCDWKHIIALITEFGCNFFVGAEDVTRGSGKIIAFQ